MIKLAKHISFVLFMACIVFSCQQKFHKQFNTNPAKVDTVQVFENYDFNSGEYELFGEYWSDFQRNSLADSIGAFSIKDTVILNQIKNSWKFETSAPYECGYDYTLYLTKNDSIIKTFDLNIKCNSMVILGTLKSYTIDRSYIEALYGKTDSIEVRRVVFYGQDLAVNYLKKMREDSSVFVLDNGGYIWENYIGYFEVTYTNPKINDKLVALAEVQNGITKKYKTAAFELENIGSNKSTGTYKIRIYCDEKLADGFDLYPVRKEYSYIINYSMKEFKRL
jgi:hypothetical protein